MPRQVNVEAVIAAIGKVYRTCGAIRPTKAAIIAESGVAHKTFYRVLQDHPEVKRQLELAEAVFDRTSSVEAIAATPDQMQANPRAVISELLDTITKLTEVIESQRKWIRSLERQIGTAPAPISGTGPRRLGRRTRYRLRLP